MSNKPETIWIDDRNWYIGNTNADGEVVDVEEYTRADTITELRRQNAALKEFAKATWDVLDEQAFEAGASLGVFDTDQYGGYAFAYWMLTETAAMPALSKAQVVREFWDAVEKRAKELRNHPDYNGCDEDAWQASYDEARALILKEWEDETR